MKETKLQEERTQTCETKGGKRKKWKALAAFVLAAAAALELYTFGIPIPAGTTLTASSYRIGEETIAQATVTLDGCAWIRLGREDVFKGTVTVAEEGEVSEKMTAVTGDGAIYLLFVSSKPEDYNNYQAVAYSKSPFWKSFGIDMEAETGVLFGDGTKVVTCPEVTKEELSERNNELRRSAGWPMELLEQETEESGAE